MEANMKKRGVILVNLGTPEQATPGSVRSFLRQFLSDKRVVDLPRWLWYPLLNGLILPLRSGRVAKLYQEIWTEQGAPLLTISKDVATNLQLRLDSVSPCYLVELAMTYGFPSLQDAWNNLQAQGVSELVILPMYPQYSVSTTAAVWDAWASLMGRQTRIPSAFFCADYHAHPLYLSSLAESVREQWHKYGKRHLLFSFHGIPVRYAKKGDPYPRQCQVTAEGVASLLGLERTQWSLSYQSRFGKEPWLTPYTDEMLVSLVGHGVNEIDVICPGFAVDCLETLNEIAMEGKEIFMQSGGKAYGYIPALNSTEPHIALYEALVLSVFAR